MPAMFWLADSATLIPTIALTWSFGPDSSRKQPSRGMTFVIVFFLLDGKLGGATGESSLQWNKEKCEMLESWNETWSTYQAFAWNEAMRTQSEK